MTKVRNVALAFSALSFLAAAACDDPGTGGNGLSLNLPDGGSSGLALPGASQPGDPATTTSTTVDGGDGTTTPDGSTTTTLPDGGKIHDAGSYDAAKNPLTPVQQDQTHAELAPMPASSGASEVLLALFAITA